MECQLVLQTQAAPALIGKVGEPQSGRVSYGGVDAYLSRRRLKFDRGVLRAMFEEADFKREGSLGPRDFLATVSGRYPKRRYTAQWRQLAALLLGVPSLKLLDVDREPVSAAELAVHRKRAVFPYSFWADVEDLPPPPKPTLRPPARRAAVAPPPREWEAVLARAAAVQGGDADAGLPRADGGGGGDGGVLIRCSRGVVKACSSSSGGRSGSPEAYINAGLGLQRAGNQTGQQPARAAAAAAGPQLVSTFAATERFDGHAGGILLASRLRAEAAGATSATGQQEQPQWQPFGQWLKGASHNVSANHSSQSAFSSSKAARLAARLSSNAFALESSLQRLRNSVKTPAEKAPPFLMHFHPLKPGDEDRFQSLGLPLELRNGIHSRQQ